MEIRPGTKFVFSNLIFTVTEPFVTHSRPTPNEWVAVSETGLTVMSFTEKDILDLKYAER